jgi:hypothetical protein
LGTKGVLNKLTQTIWCVRAILVAINIAFETPVNY